MNLRNPTGNHQHADHIREQIVLGLVVPVIMALLLNEVKQLGLKKCIQTLVYLPHFLSWVTVAAC